MGSNGRSDPCLGRAMLRVPSAVGIGTFAGISARRLAADRRWSGDPWSHWFYLASEASLTKPPTWKKVDSGEKRVDRRLPRTRCFRHDPRAHNLEAFDGSRAPRSTCGDAPQTPLDERCAEMRVPRSGCQRPNALAASWFAEGLNPEINKILATKTEKIEGRTHGLERSPR